MSRAKIIYAGLFIAFVGQTPALADSVPPSPGEIDAWLKQPSPLTATAQDLYRKYISAHEGSLPFLVNPCDFKTEFAIRYLKLKRPKAPNVQTELKSTQRKIVDVQADIAELCSEYGTLCPPAKDFADVDFSDIKGGADVTRLIAKSVAVHCDSECAESLRSFDDLPGMDENLEMANGNSQTRARALGKTIKPILVYYNSLLEHQDACKNDASWWTLNNAEFYKLPKLESVLSPSFAGQVGVTLPDTPAAAPATAPAAAPASVPPRANRKAPGKRSG